MPIIRHRSLGKVQFFSLKILVALGGNAILQHRETGTADEQFSNVRTTSKQLAQLLLRGHLVAITHGNGPQVGDILLKNELAKNTLPPMPLDVCGAESQGMIGYMMQQSLDNELRSVGLDKSIVTLLTQTLVDVEDAAFKNPSKPIGPFYSAMEASKIRQEKGWTIINDSGRGYRRVVPSPSPVEIIEGKTIKSLFDAGVVVISTGGGGIPVKREKDGRILTGVEAVIDKDLGAALLATSLGAEILLILTDVDKVSLDFGKPSEKNLERLTIAECEKYLSEGQFPRGSMGPKVEAACRFVRSGGNKAIITSLNHTLDALEERNVTVITSR
jgi:carbamate kinase